MHPIKEFDSDALNYQRFHSELVTAKKPVVFRGLVKHWPLVQKANQGAQTSIDYLLQQLNDHPSYTVVAPPSVKGRLFFSEDLTGFNFQAVNASIRATIKQMEALQKGPSAHAISIQAASIKDCAPSFKVDHNLAILDDDVEPTMWISNRSRVSAHFDLNDNIAAVAVGRRRFTLFPPDQIANLYIGPTLRSPGGVPSSLVDIQQPNFDKFPRFKIALDQAQFAELDPGDAIFIPSPWCHSVESLEPFNVLINYWWNPHLDKQGPNASNSLMMSMLTIAKMDQPQREAWKHLFNYFVFKESGDPAEHLPANLKDIATVLDESQVEECYALLRDKLTPRS
ncbi:MAG: cupin-like domain-containing protein [Acidiferrobacterales bacterium]|nr:cupin-like domain-containing protein [Acidiferrobacterales bacterium]